MKTMALTLVALLALAGPALANQCPMMIERIEAALARSPASEATRARVLALVAEGRALHDAGDHAASEAKLAEAMALLGL